MFCLKIWCYFSENKTTKNNDDMVDFEVQVKVPKKKPRMDATVSKEPFSSDDDLAKTDEKGKQLY